MKLVRLLVAVALVACGGAPTPKPIPPPAAGSGAATAGAPAATEAPLALNPAIRHGVLPNGLTYYVLPHAKPEKRAYLWLAVNAGAVQEDDDQRGLAHLVEHMAFNGTKRFPKDAIVKYVESIGMKFGADLNARTTFDETVYQLQVPTDDPGLIAKGFDVVRDWAGDVTFDPAEVEKERGVVMEEWRLGRGFQQRLLDKLIGAAFGDSKYAKRLPIGLPEIIQKAPRDRIVKFYKDWYRPDLMAVIAVGDFSDPAAIEQQIRAKFGDLAKPASPRPHGVAGVPSPTGTKVEILTDKELPLGVVAVANLIGHRPEATRGHYRRALAEQLYQAMLNERLQSIGRRPDAPFAQAGAIIQGITREVDAFARFAVVKNGDAAGALGALFTEIARIDRHGFAQSELDRARTVLLRRLEQAGTEEPTRDGRDLTEELVRNFLEHEFVIGAKAEHALAAELLPSITLAEVQQVVRGFGGAENRLIVLAGPEGKPLPDRAKVLAIGQQVGASKLDPWKDEVVSKPLMEPPGWPGSVTKETKIDALGVTEWRLSNGVRVVVKPTDYERDHVTLIGSSPGGLATAPAKDYVHARFADQIVAASGVGEFDADALGKALAGKQVAVRASIGATTDEIAGSGSARDLETMLQLVHLEMTAARRDEQAFTVWKTTSLEALRDQDRVPEVQFTNGAQALMWKNHPRHLAARTADVEHVDLDKALDFYRSRFADASDFTFVIVGAVELDKLKPLVATYLGSLPGGGKPERELDDRSRRVAGVVQHTWNLGQDQSKASVQLLFHGDEAWSRDKDRDMYVLSRVLSMRLLEVLREDMSGVYGVGARGALIRGPHQERTFAIQFGCAPGAVDKLIGATFAEIAKIAKTGIDQSYLDKVKQTFVRERETAMRTNAFWASWLSSAARYGDDPKLVLDPAPFLARMTPANVKAAAKRYLDKKRYFQAVLLPAKK